MQIEVVGIYPVDAPEPCHLVELLVRDHKGAIDIGSLTQRTEEPSNNWQAPWDERVLNAEGTADLLGQFPSKIESDGSPIRLVFFFHYLDLGRPLSTPAGDVVLKAPTPRPGRLAFMEYESPC